MAPKGPSSGEKRISPEGLLEEALEWLHVEGRPRAQAKENILDIVEQYKGDEDSQKSSLSVGGAVSATNDLAKETRKLANQYRLSPWALQVGTATSPLGELKSTDAETEDFKNRTAERANKLDEWANEFQARANSWSEQPRQIQVHENINLTPKRRLINDAAMLFDKHRPRDFHAGQDGPLYAFTRVISELATGKTPSNSALLTPLRDIVDAIRKLPPQ